MRAYRYGDRESGPFSALYTSSRFEKSFTYFINNNNHSVPARLLSGGVE